MQNEQHCSSYQSILSFSASDSFKDSHDGDSKRRDKVNNLTIRVPNQKHVLSSYSKTSPVHAFSSPKRYKGAQYTRTVGPSPKMGYCNSVETPSTVKSPCARSSVVSDERNKSTSAMIQLLKTEMEKFSLLGSGSDSDSDDETLISDYYSESIVESDEEVESVSSQDNLDDSDIITIYKSDLREIMNRQCIRNKVHNSLKVKVRNYIKEAKEKKIMQWKKKYMLKQKVVGLDKTIRSEKPTMPRSRDMDEMALQYGELKIGEKNITVEAIELEEKNLSSSDCLPRINSDDEVNKNEKIIRSITIQKSLIDQLQENEDCEPSSLNIDVNISRDEKMFLTTDLADNSNTSFNRESYLDSRIKTCMGFEFTSPQRKKKKTGKRKSKRKAVPPSAPIMFVNHTRVNFAPLPDIPCFPSCNDAESDDAAAISTERHLEEEEELRTRKFTSMDRDRSAHASRSISQTFMGKYQFDFMHPILKPTRLKEHKQRYCVSEDHDPCSIVEDCCHDQVTLDSNRSTLFEYTNTPNVGRKREVLDILSSYDELSKGGKLTRNFKSRKSKFHELKDALDEATFFPPYQMLSRMNQSIHTPPSAIIAHEIFKYVNFEGKRRLYRTSMLENNEHSIESYYQTLSDRRYKLSQTHKETPQGKAL